MKLPSGRLGSCRPGSRAPHGVGDGRDRFVLPDHAVVEPRLHPEQLLDFALHQAVDGDVRPAADDVGDVFFVDFLLQHPVPLLERGEPRLFGLDLLLERRKPAVLQLRGFRVVAGALRAVDFDAHLLELFLQLAPGKNGVFLLLPVAGQPALFFLEVSQLLLELLQALLRRLVCFLLEGLALDLELHDPAFDLVELGGHRVDLHTQARGGLVDQIDRLVGQKPVRDVAVGQHGGRHERRVLEFDAVMDLVALAQAAQDADRVLDARLAHDHGLEAPLERRVLLDVLAILVERRRADGVELAARQHRLEHVGRVHRAFGGARAHDCMELVDEEDHLAGGVRDFLEDRLQALLELAAILRAGDERAHVERDDLLVLQTLRDVLPDNPLSETFDDGGLADAWLADEHRVVLRAAREDLDHAANLVVSSDDRVELALARELGEVAAVALERLIRGLRGSGW